jgi:hypothetical protein
MERIYRGIVTRWVTEILVQAARTSEYTEQLPIRMLGIWLRYLDSSLNLTGNIISIVSFTAFAIIVITTLLEAIEYCRSERLGKHKVVTVFKTHFC